MFTFFFNTLLHSNILLHSLTQGMQVSSNILEMVKSQELRNPYLDNVGRHSKSYNYLFWRHTEAMVASDSTLAFGARGFVENRHI